MATHRLQPAQPGVSRLLVLSGTTVTLCMVAIGAITWIRTGSVSTRVWGSMLAGWKAAVWQPWFFAFIVGLWFLQWRFPGRAEERQLTNGLVQDLAWFLLTPFLAVSVISGYLVLLSLGVTSVFGRFNLDLVPWLGPWKVAVIAFVLSDFLNWVAHWLHHRLPTLWRFHAVHHSQTRMNVLSDNRTHVVETMIASTIAFLPAWFMGLNTAAAATLAISTIYMSAFIHTNIRTNLGPLRFVLVSPQAHRVHHSVDSRYFDTNYGTVFSWWDYLFNTRYAGDDEYPPTGITDQSFPMEVSVNPVWVAGTWALQLLHPFRVLATSAAYR